MKIKLWRRFFGVAAACSGMLLLASPGVAQTQPITPDDIYTRINNVRAVNHLNALSRNAALARAAHLRAADMTARGYFSHTSPDGDMPWDVALRAGYDYELIGENLAIDWLRPDDVITAWLDSSTHRENIMKPAYTETGIAVTCQSAGCLIVQLFGNRAAIAPPTPQQNITVVKEPFPATPSIPNSSPGEKSAVLGSTIIKQNSPVLSVRDRYPNCIAFSYYPVALGVYMLQ